MPNPENELNEKIASISAELANQQTRIDSVVSILGSIHSAIDTGFKQVNSRLANLEGTHGMEGVNNQLAEIKTELMKIQHVHGYKELYDNQQFTQGEA